MKQIIQYSPNTSKKTIYLIASSLIIMLLIIFYVIISKSPNMKVLSFLSAIFMLNFIFLIFSTRSDKPDPLPNTPKEFEEIYSKFTQNLSLKNLEFTSTLFLVTLIGAAFCGCVAIFGDNTILRIIFFVLFSICLYICIKAFFMNKKEYTDNIIPEFIKLYNSNFKYNPKPNQSTEQQIVMSSGFYDSSYKYSFYNSLDGFWDLNIPFHLCNINFFQRRSNREDYKITYSIILAYINSNKNINSNIHITSNVFFTEREKKKLYDCGFKEIFNIHSTNELLTTQILTNEVMEKLVELRRKYQLLFSINIKNDKIYLKISNCHLFIFSPFAKYLNESSFFTCFKVLNLLEELSNTMYSSIQDINL